MTSVEAHPIPAHRGSTARSSRVVVAFVIDNMGLGGTELNAVRTAEQMDRTRYDLRVVCIGADGPVSARYRAIGVPVVNVPLRSLYGPSMMSEGLRFARWLRRERVQVVHAHDMYSNVFATLWARLARVPVVIASRRWWHSLPSAKLRAGNVAAFRLASAVLANSAQVAQSVREADGAPPERVWTVTNFADDDAFMPIAADARAAQRATWRVPDGALVVGCVARLVPVKDHATLVRAFAGVHARRSDTHLVLVGDGECRANLEAQVAQAGLSHAVTFTGELRGGGNRHRLFDISTLASLSEGFPNTLVEAMAAGVPVVATAVGGSMDAVIHDETGLLVPPSDPAAMSRALLDLVQSANLRRQLGASARDRAMQVYRAEPTLRALACMYDTLLAQAHA